MTAAKKTKRVRWECPTGEHRGVLGPSKPRRENIVRYCLPCSQAAGRLVERVAPSLQRQRETAAERAAAKRKAAAERQRARDAERYVVDGVDLRDVMLRAMRLPTCKPLVERLAYRHRVYGSPNIVELVVRRSKTKAYTTGHAWNHYKITITVGTRNDPVRAAGVLLHELAHLATLARGENWNDASPQFARRCHDLHDEWNARFGELVTVDRNISGAYRGRSAAVGRRANGGINP